MNYYGSIDLSAIPKEFIKDINGKKYLNISIIETPNSRYGNSHLISISAKKEERKEGQNLIIGNIKESKPRVDNEQPPKPSEAPPISGAAEDDLPF